MATINQTTAQAGDMLSQAFGAASKLANQSAELSISQGDSTALVARTAGLAEVAAQERTLAAATKLGTNSADASYMLNQLASTMHETYAQRDQAILQLQDAQNKNLFTDGLVPWLTAQVNLPGYAQEQQVAEARLTNATNQYKALNDLTQETAQTNMNIAQTKTVASVEAGAQAIANQAQMQANDARIKGLQLNAEGIQKAQNMKQQMFDNNLRLASEARANEQMQMARENAKEAREKRAQNSKDISSYVDSINSYRASLGLPAYDQQQIRMRSNTQAGKLDLDNQFERGLILSTGTSPGQILGESAAASVQTIADNPQAKIAPGTLKILSKVQTEIAPQIQAAMAAKTVKNPAQAAQLFNAQAKELADRYQKDVSTGKGNWYAAPPLKTLAEDKEVARLPIFQQIIAPAVASGATDFQPEVFFPQALNLVKQGKMSMKDAVDGISALAKKSVAYNNGYYNYQGVGLPPQQTFPMKLETTGSFQGFINQTARLTSAGRDNALINMFIGSKSSVVDLTNEIDVQRYANQYLAGEISADLKGRAANLRKTKP